MSGSRIIHEPLMNRSGTILPRVGGGVGVRGRGGFGVIHAFRLTSPDPSLWITDRNVPGAWMAASRLIGGVW